MLGIAVQTPPPTSLKAAGKTLIHHYVGIIEKRIGAIKAATCYMAVYGYFLKQEFIKPLVKQGLHVVTKARQDVNLRYIYKSKQKGGPGRPQQYDGNVNVRAIDKRRIRCCYRDKTKEVYAAVLYCVQLKLKVLTAFVYYKDSEQPQILVSTNTEMDVMTMCKYYGLRFRIEFLIRDAKLHAGLGDCQARDELKLNYHFNLALTFISIAKATYHPSVSLEQRTSFSMADINMLHMNKLITE
jgi:hypothetical protein